MQWYAVGFAEYKAPTNNENSYRIELRFPGRGETIPKIWNSHWLAHEDLPQTLELDLRLKAQRALGLGFRVSGFGFRILGLGCRV